MKTQSEFWKANGPIAASMRSDGKSARQIGRVLKVSRSAVLGWLHRNGYSQTTESSRAILDICVASVNEGSDIYEVARTWDISADTIKGHIRRMERRA